MTKLSNRVAVVTGAEKGIGRATAMALAEQGADLVLNYFESEAATQTLAATVEALGSRVAIVKGDVSRREDVARLLGTADALGGANILVNNAGIFPRVPLLEMTEADWQRVLDVNLKGAFLCLQAMAKSCVAAGRAGAIVNLTSGAAFRGSPRGVHYVSSKAGILGLTRAASQELAPNRIRVNAVAPGLTDTAQPRDGMTEDEIAVAGGKIPLGRMATPEDIARTIVFLCSDDAQHITGQTLHVNGGDYLY